MNKIYFISCTSRKKNYKCFVEEMYSESTLFKVSLEYALHHVDDKNSQIFILSAKYGLLPLSKEIEPYDKTLNKMSASQRKEWGKKVYEQIQKHFDMNKTIFVFLAGKNYIKPLEPYLDDNQYINPIPNAERAIGKRIKWLRKNKDV